MLFFKVLKNVLKNVVVKNLNNCKENTSAGVSFCIKVGLSCRPAIKKDIHAQVFSANAKKHL